MRERLSDEEIRASWEVLQEDDPEPRHPWQWPSYEAGVRWAEDQYREGSWAEPTADRVARLRQRDKDYADYCARERDQMRPNHGVAFLTGWDAAEASRDPAVLSYLVKPEDAGPADDPGDAPRRAQVEFDPEPMEPQLREPVQNLYSRSDFTMRTGRDPEKYPATYEGWLVCWDYLHPMLKGAVEHPEPWALQSETCACRLDSTGLHLCADSAGDVEILMRRHVWDALLSQCPLTLPPAPPEPDWPAWWATTSVDLTQMRIGSPQIREGARARRFIQEIRDDGTVKLTPVLGEISGERMASADG